MCSIDVTQYEAKHGNMCDKLTLCDTLLYLFTGSLTSEATNSSQGPNKTDKLRKSKSETMIVGGVAIARSLETELPISVHSSKTSLKQTTETGNKDGVTQVTHSAPYHPILVMFAKIVWLCRLTQDQLDLHNFHHHHQMVLVYPVCSRDPRVVPPAVSRPNTSAHRQKGSWWQCYLHQIVVSVKLHQQKN